MKIRLNIEPEDIILIVVVIGTVLGWIFALAVAAIMAFGPGYV